MVGKMPALHRKKGEGFRIEERYPSLERTLAMLRAKSTLAQPNLQENGDVELNTPRLHFLFFRYQAAYLPVCTTMLPPPIDWLTPLSYTSISTPTVSTIQMRMRKVSGEPSEAHSMNL